MKMKTLNPFTFITRLLTRKMYIVSEETDISRDFRPFS